MIIQITNEAYSEGYDIIVAGVGEIGANAVEKIRQPYRHITHSLKMFSEEEGVLISLAQLLEEYNDVCKQGDYIITIVDFDDEEATHRAYGYTKIPKPRNPIMTPLSDVYPKNENCRSICITLSKYNTEKYEKYANYFDNIIFVDNTDQLHLPIEILLLKHLKGLIGLDICDIFSIFQNGKRAYMVDIKAQTEMVESAFLDEFTAIIKQNDIKKFNIFFEFSISVDASFDFIEDIVARIAKIVDTVDSNATIIWSAVFDETLKNDIWMSAIIAEVEEHT